MAWFELDEKNLVNLNLVVHIMIREFFDTSDKRFYIKFYTSSTEISTEMKTKEECEELYARIRSTLCDLPPHIMENLRMQKEFQGRTLELMKRSVDISDKYDGE